MSFRRVVLGFGCVSVFVHRKDWERKSACTFPGWKLAEVCGAIDKDMLETAMSEYEKKVRLSVTPLVVYRWIVCLLFALLRRPQRRQT